jgi:hypothetical protein
MTKIKKDEVGGACSAIGVDGKFVYYFYCKA